MSVPVIFPESVIKPVLDAAARRRIGRAFAAVVAVRRARLACVLGHAAHPIFPTAFPVRTQRGDEPARRTLRARMRRLGIIGESAFPVDHAHETVGGHPLRRGAQGDVRTRALFGQ